MNTWKLPRTKKKAFIARYGRAAYKALRYLDRTRREGVLCLRHETGRRLDISADFGTRKPVAVISEQVGDSMHVLAAVRLSPGAVQVQERSRGIGRTAEQAGRDFREYLVERASNSPGSLDLYRVPSAWLQVPRLIEEYKARPMRDLLGIDDADELARQLKRIEEVGADKRN